MKLDDILSEWDIDTVIDETNLSKESLSTPKLHSKYLRYYAIEKVSLSLLEEEFRLIFKDKYDYFAGRKNTDSEFLKSKNLLPFQMTLLKEDLKNYVMCDEEIQKIMKRKALQTEKVNVLDQILKSLAYRNNTIKNSIDYQKLMAGLSW